MSELRYVARVSAPSSSVTHSSQLPALIAEVLHGNSKLCPHSNVFVQTVMDFQKASEVSQATHIEN